MTLYEIRILTAWVICGYLAIVPYISNIIFMTPKNKHPFTRVMLTVLGAMIFLIGPLGAACMWAIESTDIPKCPRYLWNPAHWFRKNDI